ncbi:MAG: hypothetical protein KDE27_24085 [Planctomycetes bacterium]|nr:hypothetical protein [Planctomycetota bacterium]
MRIASLLTTAAVACLATTAVAQNNNYLNRTLYFEATWAGFVTGAALANGGDALDTINTNELTEFGVDATLPDKQLITGMIYVLQDQNAATTHSYNIVGYPDDPAVPGQPDVANPFLNAGPATSPAGSGIQAWIFTVGFTTPAQAERGENNYLGVRLPGATATTDILLNQFIDSDSTNTAGFSAPGQSYPVAYPTPTTSHRVGVDQVTMGISYSTRPGANFIDPEVQGPGGHALTNSNEITNPAVTAPASPVTTSYTAFFPDAVNFNNTATPRADGAGYVYQDNAFAPGDFVAFLAGFTLNPLNTTASPFPVSMFGAGTGNVCTDLVVNFPVSLFLAPTSLGTGTPVEQYFELTFPVPVNVASLGFKIVMQGFSLYTSAGSIAAGPCAVQTF